ncbi:MAG: endolytic transglycosylase MltG [Clostridia bacterium]|nr:endolytic transglycosylase MltG [Clostridia bacterium]
MNRSEKELSPVQRRWKLFWRYARPVVSWTASIAIVLIVVSLTINYVVSHYVSAVDPNDSTPYEVTIPQNASASSIARILYTACGEGKDGLIVSTASFKVYVDFVGKANSLKAGTYILSKNMTIKEIVNILAEGVPARVTKRVTIPEGYTVEQIAELLSKEEILSGTATFRTLCKTVDAFSNYAFLSDLPSANERIYALEGYLFPDTYEFYVESDAEEVINRMLTRYYEVYSGEFVDRANELGLTRDQVMILASIIEREARDAEDFAKVSAVFHNRLADGMKLESCATLSYATNTNRLYFSAEEMAIVSPYNTYLNAGFPIGPICNPGEAAISAALYPNEEYVAEHYLFFCNANPNLTSALLFSKTYEEQQANVDKYKKYW